MERGNKPTRICYSLPWLLWVLGLPSIVFATNLVATLIVNQPNVYGYYIPDNPKTRFQVGWGEEILLIAEQKQQKNWLKKKWFHVMPPNPKMKRWWIESKYLISQDALKKVNRNWPVRYLYYDGGECRSYYDFTPKGGVTIRLCEETYQGHVFEAPGIIEIRYPAPQFSERQDLMGYEKTTGKLFPRIVKGAFSVQGLFTDSHKPVYDPDGNCLLDCPQKTLRKLRRHKR